MGLIDAIQSRLAAASHVDRSLNYGRAVVDRFLRAAVPAAESAPVVIDLGAGHGDDLRLARSIWPTAQIHAVEAMPFHADLLTNLGFRVHHLDIERESLPWRDSSADVIIANQILEHTKELFWILHECARVLKVGGSLIVGVPNLASLHNRVLLLLGRQPTSITLASAHVRGLTRRGVAQLLDRTTSGILRLEQHRGSNFYPFPPWAARPLARALPGMAVSSFFLVRKSRPYNGEVLKFAEEARFETNYFLGHTAHRKPAETDVGRATPAGAGVNAERSMPWA